MSPKAARIRRMGGSIIARVVATHRGAVVTGELIRSLLDDGLSPDREEPDWPRTYPEDERIREALSACGGRVGEAARLLGVSRSTLWRKMRAARRV